jgi:hypothetical protein
MNMQLQHVTGQPIVAALLTERAMLARVRIKQWSAVKTDKQITDKVAEDNHAGPDAGRYLKRLVSKNSLAELASIGREARGTHEKRTLPWEDTGNRILSVVGFEDYAAKMREFKERYEAAADKFAEGYADFVQDARASLNGMFNPADYPTKEAVRAAFGFDIKISPLPDAKDFRVQLGDAQAADIKADIEARTKEAVADAMRDVYSRVAEHVGHMADKLKAFRPAPEKGQKSEGIFRDSLVENVRELAGLLPSLNVTGDPVLSGVAVRLQEMCKGKTAEDLRADSSARANVAAEAAAILETVSDYLA